MLNFRSLKQDFAPNVLKEGQKLFEKEAVENASIALLDEGKMRLNAKVKGQYDHAYECEVEIDRGQSRVTDSNCDCTYNFDCQHLAAFLFHLEQHIDNILLTYSSEKKAKGTIKKVIDEAASKVSAKQSAAAQKELLKDYLFASQLLAESPFFMPQETLEEEHADLGVVFNLDSGPAINFQICLRLPQRSKPLQVCNVKEFLEGVRYCEPVTLLGKKRFFSRQSFQGPGADIIGLIMEHARFPQSDVLRIAELEAEAFATLLARSLDIALQARKRFGSGDLVNLPCLFNGSLETPLKGSPQQVGLSFELDAVNVDSPRIIMQPRLCLDEKRLLPEEGKLQECAKPGVILDGCYYRFKDSIKRLHLRHLQTIPKMAIPEPLFGSLVENALPQLKSYADVSGRKAIDSIVTLPFAGELKARVELDWHGAELEARLYWRYGNLEIPTAESELTYDHAKSFVSSKGILARDLLEEQRITKELFEDFFFDEKRGVYIAKSEKRIVEFMTEVVPKAASQVHFDCPKALLEKFVYDNSSFEIFFEESSATHYQVKLEVSGYLKAVKLAQLWECYSTKKPYIDLEGKKKVLVLNLDILGPLLHLFDEVGLTRLDNHTEQRPLWSLVNIHPSLFENLPVKWSMSDQLKTIQEQILGLKEVKSGPIPKEFQDHLRNYQVEGVQWLERLRGMYLSGVLADDMGLGKTVQAICALSQMKIDDKKASSIIVCPTSLVYNWKQEIARFSPKMKVLVVDGIPLSRKKLMGQIEAHDVIITSYNLLQKDIDTYKDIRFGYVILDEAQHIKNRATRNAKSVKQIEAAHRLVLTGTPIENSLEDLWSLFDFLMPGLLGSFERFQEKYLKTQGQSTELLKRKVAPFILRRLKQDVLEELPPVSEIVYHCHLTDLQKELYQSYAKSAREELKKLVDREGFDKVQIQVLATLTRLKQICCHPAIFAKEKAEEGDSAKYELLMELMENLISSGHKTVIFSQYTSMLGILRDDLQRRAIKHCYLDGSSKNRVDIVDQFNSDETIPFFLVSLKAGGVGLNITGADTVIHYDMWWNPAVENQATDRVHRIGQTKKVSAYKLVTLGTIEEKIIELQNRKKGLVKKVISCDDEAIAKLTWEEVLELLHT